MQVQVQVMKCRKPLAPGMPARPSAPLANECKKVWACRLAPAACDAGAGRAVSLTPALGAAGVVRRHRHHSGTGGSVRRRHAPPAHAQCHGAGAAGAQRFDPPKQRVRTPLAGGATPPNRYNCTLPESVKFG